MKAHSATLNRVIALTLAFLALPMVRADTDRDRELRQISLWENELAKFQSLDDHGKLSALWLGLRNMGYRRTNPTHGPEIDAVYGRIQETLLAIPGHAQYFADMLEEERSKLKAGDYMGNYTDNVSRYLGETLVHLPSPETVKVLGHYLNDDRDTPAPPFGGGDFTPYPGTSMIAFEALSRIGLRNLPEVDTRVAEPPFRDLEEYTAAAVKALQLKQRKTEEALASYRAWWQEVESGRKSFSFKGQAVEYRFAPDGTWTSTTIANPPDDGPQPPPSKAPPRDHAKPPPPSAPQPSSSASGGLLPPWPWLVGGLLAIFAAGWYFLKTRKPPAT